MRRLALILTLAAAPAAAEPPRLELPVRCEIGRDCWVLQYHDQDPGPGAADYTCGSRSYQDHGGTDFGLRDLTAMAAGVPVVAAAPGVVGGVRDGVKDEVYNPGRHQAVQDQECGNGVRIEHGDGWSTLYCHMRQGSVTVRPGQQVAAGDQLGLVGMSGMAQFPHLHLGVLHDGVKIDPFRGPGNAAACGPGPAQMWSAAAQARLAYRPADITNLGFATAIPDFSRILSGAYAERRLPAEAPALVLWAELFGVRAGDRLEMHLADPQGATVVEESWTVDKTRVRQHRAIGRKRPAAGWLQGEYTARVVLVREGKTVSAERAVLTVGE